MFVSDIDGTLLKTGESIHRSVKESIANYKKLGGKITICTGRAPISTKGIVAELEIDLPCILYGGALIYDFSAKETLYQCIMENAKSDIYPVLKRIKDSSPDISIQIYTNVGIYMLNETEFLRRKGVKEELTGQLSTLQQIQGDVLKIVLSCEKEHLLDKVRSELMFSGTTLEYASRHFVELCNCNATKGKALEKLCSILNVSLSECVCAGDALTDMSMIGLCRRAYVPENAMPEMKKVAAMVFPKAEMGGLHVALDLECALFSAD